MPGHQLLGLLQRSQTVQEHRGPFFSTKAQTSQKESELPVGAESQKAQQYLVISTMYAIKWLCTHPSANVCNKTS